MWDLDHKEAWLWKNWCFHTVVLEKTLESPLDSKEIKLVNPKGNQSWLFIGRTDAKAEVPILWPPDAKNKLIRKDSDAGKDWVQEKGAEWIRWLDRITDSMDMSLNKLREIVKDREAWHATVHRVGKCWARLSNWTAAAAAVAKSLQSCPTLCDPIDGSPPGSPVPGILHPRTLEWGAISFSNVATEQQLETT